MTLRTALMVVILAAGALPAPAQFLGSVQTGASEECVYYRPSGEVLNRLTVDLATETIRTTLWQQWFGEPAKRLEVDASGIRGYYGRREDRVAGLWFSELDPRLVVERVTSQGESFWTGKINEKVTRFIVLPRRSGDGGAGQAFRMRAADAGRAGPALELLADAVYFLHARSRMQWSPEYQQRFDQAVQLYRRTSAKPALPEDARRYRVQAEVMLRDREFAKAAEFFERALEAAPWWPEGHFNLALVYEALEDYAAAIVEMRRYVALAPDASDARQAQDKVYEWELRDEAASRVDPACAGLLPGGARG